MLTEQGLVVKADGDRATVRAQRHEACHHCAAKGACEVMGAKKDVEIQVINRLHADIGDRVELTLPEAVFLKASMLTYAVPLATVMAGAVAGQILGPALGWTRDVGSIILGGVGLAAGCAVVWWSNRRVTQRDEYTPRITRILPQLAPGEHDHITC